MISKLQVIISITALLSLLGIAGWAFFRDRSRAGFFLSAALLVTALLELFDLCSLTFATWALLWKKATLFAEAFLSPFWLLSSFTYARQQGPWKIGRMRQGLVVLSFLLCLFPMVYPINAFFYVPDFPTERLLFLGNVGFLYYIGIAGCLVFALINFETTLKNASPSSLWRIKFEIIGICTILAVLVFYYGQAFSHRTLNMNSIALRSFMFVIAGVLIAYSWLRRSGNVRIQVSRQAAFKSIVLAIVGSYLILLGLLGEGMQYFGPAFPRTVMVAIAFVAGIALLLLLLSGRFKQEVRVALHKNFYQNKHDYRTQWLSFTERLATSQSGEELFERILIAYCDIFGIQGAVLFLYEDGCDGYCTAAQYAMATIPKVISKDNSLIRYMRDLTWIVNVRENDPELMEENRQFFHEHRSSFIVPLFGNERLEGFISLGHVIKDNEIFIYEDYDLMKTIARQASLAILNQRLSDNVTQTREIEAVANVATFVVHDLKNLLSNLSLIVENAARHIHNPEFQRDMLGSLGSTVVKMQGLIGRLKNLGEKELYNLQAVNLLDLVKESSQLVDSNRVIVSGSSESAFIDEHEIQKVVLNLLINGIEASRPNEPVLAEVGFADLPYIRVTDLGCGMSFQFIRTELFKPFRTTKKRGLGVGLYQCRQIVEAHGGRIEVTSLEGHGSVFTVWLPGLTEVQATQDIEPE